MKASPAVIDGAVRAAQSAPDLVARISRVDPATAGQVEALLAGQTKTQWGRVVVAGVTYVAMKYGFNWDQTVDELVAGGLLIGGQYAMRYARAACAWAAARLRKSPPNP